LGGSSRAIHKVYPHPPIIKHGLLENPPFIDGVSIYRGFSTAGFDSRRVEVELP